jgi:hypothetical protein
MFAESLRRRTEAMTGCVSDAVVEAPVAFCAESRKAWRRKKTSGAWGRNLTKGYTKRDLAAFHSLWIDQLVTAHEGDKSRNCGTG